VDPAPPALPLGTKEGSIMSESNDYWDGVSAAVYDRFQDALSRLEEIDFEFDADFAFKWSFAATKFYESTLWQVFGLAQIVSREQPITVRGAFYRAVSSGLFPDTADEHYRACGRLILQLRRLGLAPYDWVSDSTRRRLKPSSWSGLADFAETVAQAYRKDLRERQPNYIEIFVEKDAMGGVIEPITDPYDVTLNVIRGNCSETFVYRVAELWQQIEKPIHIYYLGDHDPSGLKIEKDLQRRLAGFGAQVSNWRRLAVTAADFRNPELIGFPVKKNASPASWQPYLGQYGDRCVEVDAISAAEIRDRVEEAILSHVDQHEWATLQLTEAEEKKNLLSKTRTLGGAAA
jgi:hypothetical protein